ncbi:hypothetical protein B566_EDAN009023 [Ephemera danica]|nr:hypothetical protein B566_EDAN009023 [Ephemera danica]
MSGVGFVTKKDDDFILESTPTKLLSGLYTQRRTGKFCDVKIRVGDTYLWTHTCVLSTFSAKLHNLFVTKQDSQSSRSKKSKHKIYANWSLNNPLEISLSDLKELSSVCQQARIEASQPQQAKKVEEPIPTLEVMTQEPVQPEERLQAHSKCSGRSYSCLGCGVSHRSAAALLKHLRDTMSDCSQTLVCSLCLKTRTALSSHEPRHSTETPFLCGECGRGFKWKHALRSHALVHSAEKRHLTHKMVHAGVNFRCPEPNCKFVASRKQTLAHHIATHSKERHYQCEVCGQSFSMYKNLRRHAARHEPSPAGLMCCPVPGCLYANTRLDKIKAHAERHRSGKAVRSLLMPRVRRTSQATTASQQNHSPAPPEVEEQAVETTTAEPAEPMQLEENIFIILPVDGPLFIT